MCSVDDLGECQSMYEVRTLEVMHHDRLATGKRYDVSGTYLPSELARR